MGVLSLRPGRPVSVVVFDWDGTAVPDRSADATDVRRRVELLTELGVDVVVVTGTNVGNIDRQLLARPAGPGRLFICANRGSEVFRVDRAGPLGVWARTATKEEERRLSAGAETLRDELSRCGIDTDLVYDRLNRRKVDLIPEWPDPPKSAFTELLARVEERLDGAGIGGLAEVLELAATAITEAGLPEARITSDVKHVEIGLTDKRDSIRWVARHLLDPGGPETVLVLGDEFGPVGGVEGSDFRMLDPLLTEASFVSVGAEPNGVPDEVRSVGGGPPAFLEQLDQVMVALSSFPEPVEDPAWQIEVEGFDALREREFESWLTVANGRSGTRGSLEETSEESEPATYLAGFYARSDDHAVGPELVVGPEWTRLAPRVERDRLHLDLGGVQRHQRVLDLRQGILFRSWQHRLWSGDTVTFGSARFASLAERMLMALEVRVGSGGRPVDLREQASLPLGSGPFDEVDLRSPNGRTLITAKARGGPLAAFAVSTAEEDGGLRRLVAVAGPGEEPPGREALEALTRAEGVGIARLRAEHRMAWRARWRDADVVVEGDPDAQRALRFALFHLISAGDPETDRASIGARGLTGPGYRGHVFWDTDVFVLPFFIYTDPATARALLAYRHRTLPAARAKAARLGYRGALFAWESADSGEEVTPTEARMPDGAVVPILTGLQEHHISADVAWAAWWYWKVTGDLDFLTRMGAELLLETARFWASRARRGADGRYHIGRVIGPDEYHEGVRDNAFTNVMAQWNIQRAFEVVDLLTGTDPAGWRELRRRLGVGAAELRRWRAVARGLADGLDGETLLYEQFSGYFRLEDLRAVDLAPRPFSADLVLGRRRLMRSQVLKQADVLMLPHMLPEEISVEVAEANYAFYEPRCSHGSSLSPAIHATVAARLGRTDQALAYFRMAATVDLDDRMGNAADGLHLATMGGLWQAAVMGFGGLRPDGESLRVDPRLPPTWRRLAFPVRWRRTRLYVDASPDRLVLSPDGPLSIAVGAGSPRRLGPGVYVARRRGRRWSRLEEVRP